MRNSTERDISIKQKLYPSLFEPEIKKELAYMKNVPFSKNEVLENLSRSPSFGDWIETPSKLPSSSSRPQNRMGKKEPFSSEPSSPKIPTSASKDWIGSKVPFPSDTPIHKPNSTPKINTSKYPNRVQKPILFPRPSILPISSKQNQMPTKSRSSLKRKAIESPSRTPSTSKATMKFSDNLLCELCEVSCSSALTLQQHLNGRRHKAKMEWTRIKGKPRCDVCQIWCSDYDAMKMHLKGQKHRAKVEELELCKKNGEDYVGKKKPILCELCMVHCMNEDNFRMHLKGRSHGVKEELKRRGMI